MSPVQEEVEEVKMEDMVFSLDELRTGGSSLISRRKLTEYNESTEITPVEEQKEKEDAFIPEILSVQTLQDPKRAYTNVVIADKRIAGCLLDTGANCNILGVSSAERLNLVPKNPSVSEVEGFDSGKKKIQGEVEVEMTFGPTKEHKPTKFYIVEGIEKNIIGMPTLGAFNFSINCREKTLKNNITQEVEGCAIVSDHLN